MPLSLIEFVRKWNASTLTERSAAPQHFRDLCEALDVPHPTQVDEIGANYTFEKRVSKTGGGEGFADVWKRGFFAWEYKSKGGNLNSAYKQLNEYHEALDNPPLLVVCDFVNFEVHTKFENLPTRVYAFTLDDLLRPTDTSTSGLPPLEVLRHVFGDFNQLRPGIAAVRVTKAAAEDFLRLARQLELEKAAAPHKASKVQIAHFLMRLVFCLFADSVGLLPSRAFRQLVTNQRFSPINFNRILPTLFAAMSNEGSFFGADTIPYFNGGLFSDDSTIPLNQADLGILYAAAQHDWSHIEPVIFGTLFERSLDEDKRSMIGAHYTSPEDILLLIEPVVVAPLQRRWHIVRQSVLDALAEEASSSNGATPRLKLKRHALELLEAWAAELTQVRILDPACGSGNFLYLALKRLLDLWDEARRFGLDHGLSLALDPIPHPGQLFGIEIDFYAHEIASIVVWIGFLQWKHDHGVKEDKSPVLQSLDNILRDDAIMRYDEKKQPYEPEWPAADYIVGNPPFLGGQDMQRELTEKYVKDLRTLYENRVPGSADLVLFWFEKTRALIASGSTQRAGLIGTQSIRGGENRKVLQAIKNSGDIFWAQSDRKWPQPNVKDRKRGNKKRSSDKKTMVQISMVAFDDGSERIKELDGETVGEIFANLKSGLDTTTAKRLPENRGIAFQGPVKVGKFEISSKLAESLKSMPNPHGKPNSQVIKPWMNGNDIKLRPQQRAIIDFGSLSETEAALFEQPFEYVKKKVYEKRKANKDVKRKEFWWRHGASGKTLHKATEGLTRFIITTRHSKHRIFLWAPNDLLPDSALVAIARDDDYFMGVVHSRIHEVWARDQGTQVRSAESGFRYTPKSTFDTFPFPWPPNHEPRNSSLVEAIASAARNLIQLRDQWLNPSDTPEADLKKRTLTNLYTHRYTWLDNAHRTLDEAVFAAYAWPYPLPTQEILARLLALNHQRAAAAPGPAK